MAYYFYQQDHFDNTILERAKELLKNIKNDVIPNIQNTAILLKEALTILNLPIHEIVEITITDNDPSPDQIGYVIEELHRILSGEAIERLKGSKYELYFGAWKAEYENKFKRWNEGKFGLIEYYYG